MQFVFLVFEACTYLQEFIVLICLFCSIYLACFHVCMSNVYWMFVWVVFHLFFKCMVVALFVLILRYVSTGFVRLGLLCVLLAWMFWFVQFVYFIFDTVFQPFFSALFNVFLKLFFKCLLLLCSSYVDLFSRWIGSKSQRSPTSQRSQRSQRNQRSQRIEKSEMKQFFCVVSFVVCLTLFCICF